jgi:(S)-2-hydroxy-acid oxidase
MNNYEISKSFLCYFLLLIVLQTARKSYFEYQKVRHVDFTMQECGLFVSEKVPYVGASPDAVTQCTCCGRGIFETKCPYSLRDGDRIQSLPYMRDGKLKRNHDYFYQLQAEMKFAHAEYGDFCVWTPYEMHVERIHFDEEFEQVARQRLSRMVYEYYCGGADEELTLGWNRQMIGQKYNLRPRVMCDVSRVDTTKYIYGDRLAMPIGISPTAMHKMAHPGGELATVRACKRANALMILSLFSTTSLEDVARQEPICTKWQNLYILKQRETTQSIITRAVRHAYRAIVVTCDAPILGNRRHDRRNRLSLADYPLENLRESSNLDVKEHSSTIFDASVTWQDLAELKKQVGDTVRVIAKGIMTPEDAEQALQAGVDGVYVSNHGGRQLDGCQSTIEALPAIVRAVNKRCPVLVDGGFRTGTDIIKALALGADMVFVGRAPLMGLAAFGEEGVYSVLTMLQDELKRAMMLTGCNKLSDINRNIILERQ